MRIPRWPLAIVIVLAVVAGGVWWISRPPPQITVVSWGAEYGRAQTLAMFHPYEDKTHVDVLVTNYGGGLKEIENQVSSGNITWDVIDMEMEDAAAACRQGLLESMVGVELPPGLNGAAATNDFVPGAIGPCWIGSTVWSHVIGYDSARFPNGAPRTVQDFFNTTRFPGPRAMQDNGPKFNIELALMASGVAPWQVYRTLQTPQGLDRAFAKLDTIKADIVWYRRTTEPKSLLEEGKVAMSTGLNKSLMSLESQPKVVTLWDGQLYQLDVFAIPKGNPDKTRAMDFIRFATGSEPLGQEANLLPYGPARISAIKYVTRNPETGTEMRKYLPTAPEHFQRALAVDPDWWEKNGAPVIARWNEWRKS